MRKNVFGRQFKRDRNERRALFKSLLSSLVLYERIKTSEAKAKSIKADADKLITKAKKGGLHAYRLLEPELTIEAVKKLINNIAPRFDKRQGGYTRIIRAEKRKKDNTQVVILEWTEQAPPVDPKAAKANAKKEKSEKSSKEKTKSKKDVKEASVRVNLKRGEKEAKSKEKVKVKTKQVKTEKKGKRQEKKK
jgi:large subunit ribosomal protein L17